MANFVVMDDRDHSDAIALLLIDQFDDITRNGLVLSPETVAAIGKAEARHNRWTAAALWAIALLLGWLVYLLVR